MLSMNLPRPLANVFNPLVLRTPRKLDRHTEVTIVDKYLCTLVVHNCSTVYLYSDVLSKLDNVFDIIV